MRRPIVAMASSVNLLLRTAILVVFSLVLSVANLAGEKELSPNDRLQLFDQVWSIIQDKYYNPHLNGVDWNAMRLRYRPSVARAQSDAEVYKVLRQMVGELHDTHTRVHSPDERERRRQQESVTVGVHIYEVENQPTVISVASDSEAALGGIMPGMHVLAIDGQRIADRIKEVEAEIGGMSSDRALKSSVYGRLLRGAPGSHVSLTAEDFAGRPFTVSLKRRTVTAKPKVTVRHLDGGVGYLKISEWDNPVDTEFATALSEFSAAPGLVIDLRGNGGGVADIVADIASMFFKDRVGLYKVISRKGKTEESFSRPRNKLYYAGPVVVLVDENSASGSELFAGVLQEYKRATIIGRETCGCLLVIRNLHKLKGGGELTVSELDVQTPRGKRLEGPGVIPDVSIRPTRDDLISKHDPDIAAALETLAGAQKASPISTQAQRNGDSRP